mgnify:FL=1
MAAGRAEQARLVSESEVVKKSREEATRIVDAAHVEADRMRGDCDVYVDTKLAEFESILNTTSREVLNGRKQLRSTAGVAERSDDYQNYQPTGAVYDENVDEDYNGSYNAGYNADYNDDSQQGDYALYNDGYQ